MKSRLAVLLLALAGTSSIAGPAIDYFPLHLRQLYARQQAQYGRTLDDYALRQGFKQPIERVGTVLHEMVHADSYMHQGFLVDGVYYEPYMTGWPELNNQAIAPLVPAADRDLIYTSYVLKAPSNHLGNVLDEINAYSSVAPTICLQEAASGSKQVTNLVGFLRLQETYLQQLRTAMPGDYARMRKSQAHVGAIRLITQRAWMALKACGQAEDAIPRREVMKLF